MPPAPTTIGPFRIVRVLGEGGMGVVYLGERRELFSQRVAIKILHPEISLLLGDHLLEHEDRILTSLDHPGIVRLLDRGHSEDGRQYIVMEYIDGLPLLEFCRRNPLTLLQRLTLLLEILQAVDYAHRHLVIHGDLKPQNILVPESGHPRLLDFGVAALIHTQPQPGTATYSTPAYSSPEQLSGARLTPASDVFSLGKIARAILPAPKPNSDLAVILEKSTQPDLGQRYPTVRDFANDLQALVDHRPISARPPSRAYHLAKWVRRHRAAAAMAAVILLVLAGSVVGVAIQTARAARQRRLALTRLHDVVRLTGTLQGELYDSLVPLTRSQPAQAGPARLALIQSATGTLDNLALQNANDSTLALEMARQYLRLASISSATAPADNRKAANLLHQISPHDANYPAAQALLADLH